MPAFFVDRKAAGVALAVALARYRGADVVVYGLPRGGVVTAAAVAAALGAPLDLLISRKLRHPEAPELAIGAITEDGAEVVDPRFAADVPAQWLVHERERQLREARRRRAVYLGHRPPLAIADKVAIVVDDGIATGHTMRAAIRALRRRRPARIVAAAPVAPRAAAERLAELADEVVILRQPDDFLAVSLYYRDFPQVEDEEVVALFAGARAG